METNLTRIKNILIQSIEIQYIIQSHNRIIILRSRNFNAKKGKTFEKNEHYWSAVCCNIRLRRAPHMLGTYLPMQSQVQILAISINDLRR